MRNWPAISPRQLGARLMLAGNVVSAAIRQAQLRSQIDLTRQMLELQEQQLDIAEQRHQAGGVSEYDVRIQRTPVAQTRSQLPLSGAAA